MSNLLPTALVGEREIEIRPLPSRWWQWARWEGWVVQESQMRMPDGTLHPVKHTAHLYPTRPNPPNARIFVVGGLPYALRSRSHGRLYRKLQAWCEERDAEAAHRRASERVPA